MENGTPPKPNNRRFYVGIFVVLVLILSPVWFPVVYLLGLVVFYGYTTPRSNTPFPEAHQKAITTFVESAGFGGSRMRESKYWFEFSVLFEGARYSKKDIFLLGLTPEYGDRYFTRSVPRKEDLPKATHRSLTSEEAQAVAKLRAGEPWVKLEVPPNPEKYTIGLIRVIAPIFAQQSCLECHEVKEGTLLGAFDYEFFKLEEKVKTEAEGTTP